LTSGCVEQLQPERTGRPLGGGPSLFVPRRFRVASITWVKIASWHVLKFDDPSSTSCGLEVAEDDEIFETLPPDWWEEKSCETCLRIKEAKAAMEASPVP
jgi:hypothetical protein